MVAKRNGIIASWTRSVGDFRGALELDAADAQAKANAETIEELLRALRLETQALEETIEAQRKKLEELREVIKELAKRIPDEHLPQSAQGDDDDDENFLPPERQKPNDGKGSQKKPREGDEQKMTEQEARGSLEGLKNEFGRKMPAGQKDGPNGTGGKGGKPTDKKGKDY